MSQWQQGAGRAAIDGDVLAVAVCPEDRAVLHRTHRSGALIRCSMQGVLAEVAALHSRSDLHAGLPAMRAVGYRQLWAHCDGEADLVSAREKSIIATRQLAKRQFTWLRKWPDLTWLETNDEGGLVNVEGLFAADYQNESNAGDFIRNVLRNYLVGHSS